VGFLFKRLLFLVCVLARLVLGVTVIQGIKAEKGDCLGASLLFFRLLCLGFCVGLSVGVEP
jgi:hypothetical protein